MSLINKITAKMTIPAIMLAIVLCFVAQPAEAAFGGPSTAVAGLKDICAADIQNSQGQLRIFTVGVKCFEKLINGLAEDTIMSFSEYLRDIVYLVLMIYVIFYGAKVVLGFTAVDKLKSEFFIGALKIGFITWLVFSFGLVDIYYLVLEAYSAMLKIVLTGANFGECTNVAVSSTLLSNGTDPIWVIMDCQFSKFIGWEAANGYNAKGGVPWRGVPMLLGYITSKFMPANGMILGGLMFSVLWTLMMSFFRLAFIYILSMIALILLFSISPLMVPLMLFNQTKSYFEGWYKLIISMILQPVILFAFFSFIATLLADTIARLTAVFKEMQPAFQVSGVDKLGSWQNPQQVFDMVGNIKKNIDPEILISGISTLVVAYLLMSFIGFVSKMAVQLAGTAANPKLSDLTPKFAQ